MANLETSYMGLKLKNPLIIASSPLTSNIASLKRCEESGAGAVVLKSIFEEQINNDVLKDTMKNEEYLQYSDFAEAFGNASKDYYINEYLELLSEAKEKLSIPVIASINTSHINTWADYASRFEKCGADALELNYYPIASEADVSGERVDEAALKFARQARKATKLPIAMKISYKYSSLAAIITGFAKEGMNGLVLFNRFLRPDIDIEHESVSSGSILSLSNEYAESLRWIALMSAELKKVDFAANTGIHDGETIIKMLLAGAKVTEVCSAVISGGYETIGKMLTTLSSWMDRKGYADIAAFGGRLAQENMTDGAHWERTQYMRTLQRGK